MINNNLDFEKNSNTTHSSVANATIAHHSNSNSNCNNITNNTTTPTNNGNGYFNRYFDNRIAANLAAVLNGSRFRSSSTSTPTSSPRITSAYNRFKASRANANVAAAAAAISNSNSNLNTFHNSTAHHHYSNGVATVARYPPTHLQLNNSSGSGSHPTSPMLGNGGNTDSLGRRRPLYLFTQANLNCNDNEKVAQTPSSDEDNSPTELNNCKHLVDKPPLVKRLTMGLLRSNEESRPLVNNVSTTTTTTATTNNSTTLTNATLKLNSSTTTTNKIYSNGYVNEEAFEPEKYIASKFGDSCRQSLTAIPMLETLNLNDNSEFNLKKRYLRETSSANSSPKIFANRLRTTSRYNNGTTASSTATNNINNAALDDDEDELKDASWFQAGISRDIAVEVLSSKSPGAFLVRKSTSKPGCYALTLRVPSPPGPKIANYIILRTARGYKIKGFRKEFTSLKCLITHHSVMPELLPVPLAMPRPTNMTSSRRNLDDFDTYDSLQMLLKYLRAKNLENE